MALSAVLAWTGVAAVLTVTPGVDMALVARTAIARGRRAALMTTAGIATGVLLWGIASAAGVGALLATSASVYDVVRLIGAAYLVCLGVAAWRAAGKTAPTKGPLARRTGRPAFRLGLMSNLTNPKLVVLYATVLPSFVPAGGSIPAWSLMFASIHAGLGLLWLSAYAWLLTRAARFFERRAVRRALDRLSGGVLIGLGLRLAAQR
jgi:threonine/homoserine/homoserine lactone efflux protein